MNNHYRILDIFVGCSKVLLHIVGIIWYHHISRGLKNHLDNPVPNGNFPELHCLCIRLSVSGIGSDHIRNYTSKIYPMQNLQCLIKGIFL